MLLRRRLRWHYKNTPWFRRAVRRAKDTALYWLVLAGLAVIRALPFDLAMRLAEIAGAAVHRLLPSLRDLSAKHLAMAFGDSMSPTARDRVAREATINAARSLVEIAKFDSLRPRLKDYVEVAGAEQAETMRRSPRGIIVVTGHFGNWELLAAYFGLDGLDVAAVARRFYVERINRILVDFRASNRVESIMRDQPVRAARQMLAVLKRGGVLAMLIDQDTHVQSLSVPFFGRPARTPVAPVVLALRRDIPLATLFLERLAGGGHRITFELVRDLPRTGDELHDLRLGLETLNRRFEEQLRRRPEQYMWWHKRWDRGPVAHLDLDGEFEYAGRRSTSPPDAAAEDGPDRGEAASTRGDSDDDGR
jgi:KDO2-lipid IV(A) lauroyltransferase